VLHRADETNRLLLLDRVRSAEDFLEERGHRAIGVVYHPEVEQYSNYVPTVLPRRYDAFLYLDETQALHPLHVPVVMEAGEVPETYPSGV
jgi:erythromycin esterase